MSAKAPLSEPETLRQRRREHTDESRKLDLSAVKKLDPSKLMEAKKASLWTPSASVGFKLILLSRLVAASLSPISDCDEVFNYWEACHYLHYGWGMQTWEYSPVYAIRSWFYILPHAFITWFIETLFTLDKVHIFYFTRLVLALVSATSETFLYQQIVQHVDPRVGRYYLVLTSLSTGMFISSTALLPSTLAMYGVACMVGCALAPTRFGSIFMSTLAMGIGSIVGWPFAAVLILPVILSTLWPHVKTRLEDWVISAVMTLAMILARVFNVIFIIDSYGIVPLNIVLYNVLSGNERGPDLYGTEPWYFYTINLILNFNIVFILALGCLVLWWVSSIRVTHSIFTISTLFYIWFIVFTLQPHKEERFMFVAYPLLLFNGAYSLYLMKSWLHLKWTQMKNITVIVLMVFAILSVSRITALSFYYSAPLDIYAHLREPGTMKVAQSIQQHFQNDTIPNELNVCVGKEWYRFPSHYFIPEGMRLRFVENGFKGLLPKYFKESSNKDHPHRQWMRYTHIIPNGMNDLNQHEPDRYISVQECHLMIDLDVPDAEGENVFDPMAIEPRYLLDTEHWTPLQCRPFLDAAKTSRWNRAFWMPFSKKYWGDYCLLIKKVQVSQ